MEEERFARIERGFAQPYEGARPALIIVMGPASCGKSTIGISLADAFNIPFIDGDSLHPKSNVDKMSAGTPLDDNDRLPWLALIRATAERVCREEWVTKEQGLFGVLHEQDGNLNRDVEDLAELADWEFGEGWKWKGNLKKKTDESLGVPRGGLRRPAVVIACSALKKWYRDILRGHYPVEMPVSEISGEDTEEKVMTPKPSRMDTYFVYCKGTRELLQDRIAKRKGHFMGAKMLDSQLATLEEPEGEDGVVAVDISRTPAEITKEAVQKMVGVSKPW
ncbi:putative cytoplasm protein [Filobasidium floriforme]|uniref:putative cytoplasm protein n=1 Tax=Filobasidium floriforme TaxID=5210 RepID=UPI001E8D9C40|nr:putative cytoplasm protein [Filobasidium floriforme]KAH8082650.1 putative cytoplasm protein [Filobasidium floriforme]